MRKNKAVANTQNGQETINKNIKDLNLDNGVESIEIFNIVFKHLKKRSIKNDKNRFKNIKILLPIIFFSVILIIGIIMLILLFVRRKKPVSKIKISVSELSYEKAEKMLNLQIIEINHNLLNRSLNKINESLEICNNTNFSIINSSANHFIPNFINNSTKSAFKVIKADLELYKEKYEELKESVNNFTMKVSNSFRNSYSPLNEMKKEIE